MSDTRDQFLAEYNSEHFVWASKALSADIATPTSSRIQQGWTVERPPHSLFNFWQRRTDLRLSDQEARIAFLEKHLGLVTEMSGVVLAPTIISPVLDETLKFSSRLTVSTDPMVVSGGVTDIHASTDWKITSDSDGALVVAQDVASLDRTTHIFTNIKLTRGRSYYVWARHNGAACGVGPWSNVRVTIKDTRRGELIGSDAVIIGNVDGSPFVRKDGSEYWIAVATASHRAASLHWWDDAATLPGDIPAMVNCTGGSQHLSADTINDQVNTVVYCTCAETGTSAGNTNAIMAQTWAATNAKAASFCRNVAIDSQAASLPTISALAYVWLNRTFIDSLDPTISEYADKKLDAWGFGSTAGSYVISSSECGASSCAAVFDNGNIFGVSKTSEACGVVPVIEIDA